MAAETAPPPVLAGFIDAQGHRVTAEVTPSGLVTVLARTPDEGLRSGHPCLNRENALVLGTALVAWANGEPS
jgi:hypothetical protein